MFFHSHRFRFQQTILLLLAILLFSILFPALFTNWTNKQAANFRIYEPKSCGKYILFSDASGKTTEKLDLESFLPCAVMGQLSIDSNEEFLKSFAVILRTYLWNTLSGETSISIEDLSIPYLSYDEMENLWKDDFSENLNFLNKIVSDTSLLVLKQKDTLIQPYYHAQSCGKTRPASQSYLKSADCPDDLSSTHLLGTNVFSKETFLQNLAKISTDIKISESAPLETFQILSRDESGYVTELQIGEIPVSVEQFVEIFELNSANFSVDEYNGGIRIVTKGNGHGYGMSLSQAEALAKNGSSFEDILNYFYQDITIAQAH